MAGKRSGFGTIQRLPSGRYRARYTQPGTVKMVNAPTTFDTKTDAKAWLSTIRTDLVRGAWLPPDSTITIAEYADTWLQHRTLKDRTRADYRSLLDKLILPSFGDVPMRRLTPAAVREWHARTAVNHPTTRAHAYALLRTICGTAVTDDLLPANPCRIRGAGQTKRVSRTEPATLPELAAIVDAMPERYRLMVHLAAWCGLRFGELIELRGQDIDTKTGVIKVRRAVVYVNSEPLITTPKSDAGSRDVNIPPHLLPAVREHILRFGTGRDGLLFGASRDPDRHLRGSSLAAVYYPARKKAGRPDLRFHDLRHTGATMAAQTGATLAELMARLGHTTAGVAMRYQHAAKGRDAQIAEALSKLAEQT